VPLLEGASSRDAWTIKAEVLRERRVATRTVSVIPSAPPYDDSYESVPLSFGQVSVLHSMETVASDRQHEANLLLTVTLDHSRASPAGAAALIRSLIQRHDSLRSVLTATPNGPRQRIIDAAELDVRTKSGFNGSKNIEDWVRQPFDLYADLPMRALYDEGPSGKRLHVVLHHVACDGAALELVASELAALMSDAVSLDTAPTLRDLIASEQQLGREMTTKHWRGLLVEDEVTKILIDRESYAASERHEKAIKWEMPSADLLAWCQSNSLLPATPLLTSALLFSGLVRGDKYFGLSVIYANRTSSSLARIVNSMTQVLPVSVQMESTSTWREIFEAAQWAILRGSRRSRYDVSGSSYLSGVGLDRW